MQIVDVSLLLRLFLPPASSSLARGWGDRRVRLGREKHAESQDSSIQCWHSHSPAYGRRDFLILFGHQFLQHENGLESDTTCISPSPGRKNYPVSVCPQPFEHRSILTPASFSKTKTAIY